MATVRIQLRRGTSSQWDTANPTLAAGEIGIETDTNTFKFGDGVTAWNSLDYALSNTVDDYILLSEKGVANGVATLDGSGKVPYAQIPSIDELSQDAVNSALVAGTGITKVYNDGANTITVAVDTSVIATKAELAEVSQDSINDALVAGEGLNKTYDDVNNLITIDIDSTVATLTGTQTLTNKTLTSPVINTPTGIVKADVGLSNVDNTSDVNKPVSTAQAAADAAVASNAATALSNHESDTTNIHGIANTANLVTVDGSQLLSNKTINSPIVKGDLVLEGTTDNDYELTLTTDPTANRTITLPDNSGTVALVSNLNSYAELSGATFTGAVSGTDLTLSGNLTVNGTTTNLNTTNLNVEDKNITLGDTTSPSDATADGGGFSLKGSTDKSFTWLDATDSWTSSENIDLQSGKTYKIDGNIVLSGSQVLGKSVPSGTIVGTSDTQTLTGKTIDLTDNTISGTLAEFNSAVSDADLVSLTGVETLTNKTLQSPAISSPTGILKGDVGLGDVDNTSDLNKPVSTATQSALDLKANLASPTFTGTVVLPSTTSIGNVSSSEIEALDGINSNVQTQIDAKAPSASPTFTGTVVLPSTTSIGNVSSSEIETLDGIGSNIQTQIDAKSPSANPTFTGTVVLPATTSIGNVSSSEIETLDGVTSAIQTQLNTKLESATAASTYAPIASPTFTGTVSGVTKAMVGLANVDNTADTAKPVSTATQSALDLKANLAGPTFTGTVTLPGTTSIGDVSATEIGYVNGVTSAIQTQLDAKYSSASASTDLALKANLASPALTGTPTAPTATLGTNTTQIATTEFVKSEIDAVIASAPGALNTLDELAAALGDDANFATTVTNSLAAKAPLASPTFTGTVTVAASGIAFTDGTQTKEGVPSRTTINSATAAYNLSTGGLALRDTLIECNSSSAFTVTIPANSTTAYPIGTSIDLLQVGTGQVTVAGAAGVTLNGTPGLKLRTQWSSATLFKRATDTWVIMGDLTA